MSLTSVASSATAQPIALTPKAFDLLVTLVQHHTRALSKDEILTLVWSGSVVEEGNLAQQVLLLRRALVDAGDCVATVPRHGYRFVAPVIEEQRPTRPQRARTASSGTGASFRCARASR